MTLLLLLLSNQVTVAAVVTNEFYSGTGVIYRDATNVNALLVQKGYGKLNHELMKHLPLLEQYKLLRAERAGQTPKAD